ncbi:centrobin [Phlebotomus argentipes]|uniref:centrobin n=1 Tax=Phlebotomus argentipes TaxID=94469 RepID=UPI0028929BFA|nr:centrobin [Phlebotomus argentipes]
MRSDDTEVLLLIPPDFFIVQETGNLCSSECLEAQETFRTSVNIEGRMDASFLKEIDSFLQEKTEKSVINLSDISLRDLQPLSCGGDIHEKAQSALQRHSESMTRQKTLPSACRSIDFSAQPPEVPLISLSELWSSKGGGTESASLQEERLRREHCEKSIHLLQARILEYQQKLVVAMEVDRTKDDTIAKLQENLKRLESQNLHLNVELRERNGEVERRCAVLETELRKSVEMARDLQDRNEVFHSKVIHLTKANEDVKEITRKQMEDLQVRLSNSLKVEQLLNDDLVKAKTATEEEKLKLKDMEREIQEARAKTEMVLREKSSLQTAFDLLNEKLKSTSEDTQAQQSYLKSYYQSQLNSVVGEKVKEFQQQLDAAEAEAHNLGRLCEKHEQEISLLTEKHSEELSLSHFQLAVATKTIEELREKLSFYENRRQDIAQKLHSVMEDQWQKALKILGSPAIEEPSRQPAFFQAPREDPLQDQMQAYMKILLKKSLSEIAQGDPTRENPEQRNDKTPSKRNKQRPWR